MDTCEKLYIAAWLWRIRIGQQSKDKELYTGFCACVYVSTSVEAWDLGASQMFNRQNSGYCMASGLCLCVVGRWRIGNNHAISTDNLDIKYL